MDADTAEATQEEQELAATSPERLRNAAEDAAPPVNEPRMEELLCLSSGIVAENAPALLEGDAPTDDAIVANEQHSDHGHSDAADAVGDMELLVRELMAIRSVLESSTGVNADDDLVQHIRVWSDRIRPASSPPDNASPPVLATLLIPMAPPTDSYPDKIEGLTWRAVDFDDGVYRGQVKQCVDAAAPSADAVDAGQGFIPHGWGVVTSHRGLRRIGVWHDGEQIGVGSLQSTVLLYDGEWHATQGPSGYGIGTFAFGVSFVGAWRNGRPYGLGRLCRAETKSTLDGWFHGTHCLQPVEDPSMQELEEELVRSHLPAPAPSEQPRRGLFRVGTILELARLASLRHAMTQWRRRSCEQVVVVAQAKRMEAIQAWTQAHAAERKAIAWNTAHQVQCHRQRRASLLQAVAAGREHHTRVQRVRDFHTNRLDTAILQRDLARRCVLAQEESIALMEAELAQVTVLVDEATQAQADCKSWSLQQHHIKRQIENATVKINALKHQLQLQADGSSEQHDDAAQRKHLKTPTTPAHARAIHAPRHVTAPSQNNAQDDEELPFVCDVAGCSCGIPRDVFLRVARVLNGE